MSTMHRGAQRIHSRWRPRPPQPTSLATTGSRDLETQTGARQATAAPARGPWTKIIGIACAALLALAIAVGARHAASTTEPALVLPRTPTAWVQEFTAAAIDNPTDVCRRLFAPTLAAVFKPDTGRRCLAYYRNVTSTSFRIRHILQNGGAAAVEARQIGEKPGWGYYTFILGHVPRGWQAVDIVPGGPISPR